MDSPCDDNGQEVWTSQMIVAPAFVDAAAKDLATIGSAISRANAEALVPITALLPAGADDVSAAIAALFATHGQAYQELSAHAVAFHEQFVQLMSAGAAQYASAEAANSSPLQIVGQTALDAINSPVQTLTGRPLIGNGANGVAGTGQNGGDGGWLYGNGGNGEVRAVDGISLELRQGRTLGIVGESGSGKSTTLHEILELAAPQSGSIEVLGTDVATLGTAERRSLRRDIQVVFQDPVASLDPRLPVFDLIAEPLQANGFGKNETHARVAELLDIVGLRHGDASRYPAEFSGGQKQRIGIARALALQPKILALDEPVSALDVSIQAGIINLLLDLQEQFGLSYLFVSHDLSVVKHLAHQVAVMLAGTVVEQGDSEEVFGNPKHEYTRRLLGAVPQPDPARRG